VTNLPGLIGRPPTIRVCSQHLQSCRPATNGLLMYLNEVDAAHSVTADPSNCQAS
jgi:hypothetical protein